jgi:hypothetical protein
MKKISKPEPIEFEIEDCNGNTKILSCKTVTNEMYEKISQCYKEDKNAFVVNREQMAIIFGGVESDYLQFDQRQIKAVLNGFNEIMSGPIQPQD